MSQKLLIPLLLGSGREGRRSEKVAHFVADKMRAAGFETPFVDVRDYVTGVTYHSRQIQPPMMPWRDLMARADGLIIVTPEYNHGFPGELKILLDSVLDEYERKPVGICGVSAGRAGGARAIEQVRDVVIALQMVPLTNAPTFGNVGKFDPAENDKYVDPLIEEMRWFATVLKPARADAGRESVNG
jgi:NAD(P)H-dependent FMN reductase